MQRLTDIIKRHIDEERPIRRAEVVGNARWMLEGPSYIDVLLDGVRRSVIYRDGAVVPLIGSFVQVRKQDAGTTATWRAWPLAPDLPVIANCEYDFYFRRNGRLTDPPNELPPNMAGTTVTATTTLSAECRNVRIGLRTYIQTTGGVDISEFDNDTIGPIDGPQSGLVLSATVPNTSYRIQYIVTNNDAIPV